MQYIVEKAPRREAEIDRVAELKKLLKKEYPDLDPETLSSDEDAQNDLFSTVIYEVLITQATKKVNDLAPEMALLVQEYLQALAKMTGLSTTAVRKELGLGVRDIYADGEENEAVMELLTKAVAKAKT